MAPAALSGRPCQRAAVKSTLQHLRKIVGMLRSWPSFGNGDKALVGNWIFSMSPDCRCMLTDHLARW